MKRSSKASGLHQLMSQDPVQGLYTTKTYQMMKSILEKWNKEHC